VLAQVEIDFSNSMIEAFWRSIKHNWLFLNQLDTPAAVERLVAFYVTEHNSIMPHAAFNGQTLRRPVTLAVAHALRERIRGTVTTIAECAGDITARSNFVKALDGASCVRLGTDIVERCTADLRAK
jgi:hypothetical protein